MPGHSRLREPGRTEEEAVKNIQDAIKECLEVRAEKGMPLEDENVARRVN